MWFAYIVKCADGTFYTGITTDVRRRVEEHNGSVLGAKNTRSRRPVKLVYSCKKKSKSLAVKEEHRIKELGRPEKIKLIRNGKFKFKSPKPPLLKGAEGDISTYPQGYSKK